MATKKVIVEFQGHSRIVSFQESENEIETDTAAVKEIFRDVFSSPPSPFFLEILNDTFNQPFRAYNIMYANRLWPRLIT